MGSPAYYWDNPYPPSGIIAPNLDPGALVGNTNPTMIPPGAGKPATQINWSLQVQRAISNNLTFNVAYVGAHTYGLGFWSKPNQISPQVAQQYVAAAANAGLPLNQWLSLPINDPRAAAAGVTAPFPTFAAVFGPGATIGQALRPFPQYGNIDNVFNPIGTVSYNALQSSLQQRFSNGLTFLVSYTFQKTLGTVDSLAGAFAGGENAIFGASFNQDYYNPKSQRSVTSSDIPHVLAISYNYELPFGPRKRYLSQGGVLGKVVGGWQISGIQQYQSGYPVHIQWWAFGSNNPFFAGADGFSFTPNLTGQPLKNPAYDRKCSGPVTGPGRVPCQFYYNPAAFAPPAPGTFGTAPNNIAGLRVPWFFNEDISVSKRTHIGEKVSLQFQANFFNVFNRTIFGPSGGAPQLVFAPPDLSQASLDRFPNTNFGLLTEQANLARRIQVSLRLEF